MSIVSDFDDIARRMNRKPEATPGIVPLATPFAVSIGLVPRTQMPAGADQTDWLKLDAAVKTLQSLGYTYKAGAEMWKPPVAAPSGQPTMTGNANYNNALFGSLKSRADEVRVAHEHLEATLAVFRNQGQQATTKPFESARTYHEDAAEMLMEWRQQDMARAFDPPNTDEVVAEDEGCL